MKINAIQNFYIHPNFTSRNQTNKVSYIYNVKPDTFENTSSSFDNSIKNYYKQLKSDMEILEEKDVKLMAQKISIDTGVDIDTVYETMGKLSAFSSYKSLDVIKKYIKENDVRMISNILPYYDYNNGYNWEPTLSNVLHYISLRNFNMPVDRTVYNLSRKAIIIDSKLLNIIKNMSEDERMQIYKKVLKKPNNKLVYIDGFENSYNFLNQGENFADYTIKILKKAKSLQEKNGKSINHNVNLLLNGKNYSVMKELGLNPDIIKADYDISPKGIANNLNPIIPTDDEFVESVKEAAFDPFVDVELNRQSALDFMKSMNIIVTPKQYCNHLKNMHKQITTYLKKNKRDKNNVYYLIPSNKKSPILVNYEYFKINKIKNPKILYLDRGFLDFKNLKNSVPKNSTIIVLDDCAISGLSYTGEVFDYEKMALRTHKEDNISFIIAPMFTTSYSLDKINKISQRNSRENIDKIIYSKQLPEWFFIQNFQTEFPKVECPYITSLVLPYMGPDSNCEELVPLYEKFLYHKNAQKDSLGIFD